MPKFALFVRANPTNESSDSFSSPEAQALLPAMMTFNESLVDAGVLLAAEGLLPSSKGARVHYSSTDNGGPTVTRGPFDAETLVSGYWIIRAENLEEAIGWAKKVPFNKNDDVVEVRQVNTVDDFGGDVTEEVRGRVEELGRKMKEAQN